MNNQDLEQLYDTYAHGLFHYLLGFTKAEADARDLLQDVFIKLAREKQRQVKSEKAFIYRLAHNLAIDWLRRRQARRNGHEAWFEHVGTHKQQVQTTDQELLLRAFADALKSLPAEQRTIFDLKLWEGLTFEQIAEVQQIPLNTAASRWRYAVEKLRTLLRPIYKELQ